MRTRWTIDPVVVGGHECDAWVAYYRREWRPFLRAAVGMVHEGFGMGRLSSLRGAWHVLRANQVWAPVPDNDPVAAREHMVRFYRLVARSCSGTFDPVRAAALEVEWWRLHRLHQRSTPGSDVKVARDELVRALAALYAYVYAVPAGAVSEAARLRVDAMDASDAWVAAGCALDDPMLVHERELLVASYSSLRAAVGAAPSGVIG